MSSPTPDGLDYEAIWLRCQEIAVSSARHLGRPDLVHSMTVMVFERQVRPHPSTNRQA